MEERLAVSGIAVKDGGTLVARDAQVDLPEASLMTTDMNMPGGTTAIPARAQFESMEATIYTKSLDGTTARLKAPGLHKIEVRWLEDVADRQGNIVPRGTRVYIEGLMKSWSDGSPTKGELSEATVGYEVVLYQMWNEQGAELVFIDKRTGIYRVGGVDYTTSAMSFLGL